MDRTALGSSCTVRDHDHTRLESLQFREEIQRLIKAPPENTSSFTALLQLQPTQAMELLHTQDSDGINTIACVSGEPVYRHTNELKPSSLHHSNGNLTFPALADSIEQAEANSPMVDGPSSVPPSSKNLDNVKNEPTETESKMDSSLQLTSDPSLENKNHRAAKRKEREQKIKGSTKKSKSAADESTGDGDKLPYVHVRARRGQATDSHSLAERARREKINVRMKLLQELVPGCSKISGTALILDEIINHVQTLQRQVEILSMKLAAVNPGMDFNLDSMIASEGVLLTEGHFPNMVPPVVLPEMAVNGSRQQYQPHWNVDAYLQPLLGRDEENHDFITPENSLLSHDSSGNSASLHSNQLNMEL